MCGYQTENTKRLESFPSMYISLVIGTSDGLSHQNLPSHQMALEALDASAAHGLLHRLVRIPGGRAFVT